MKTGADIVRPTQLGYDAGANGITKADCPYADGSAEQKSWLLGWELGYHEGAWLNQTILTDPEQINDLPWAGNWAADSPLLDLVDAFLKQLKQQGRYEDIKRASIIVNRIWGEGDLSDLTEEEWHETCFKYL